MDTWDISVLYPRSPLESPNTKISCYFLTENYANGRCLSMRSIYREEVKPLTSGGIVKQEVLWALKGCRVVAFPHRRKIVRCMLGSSGFL